VRDHSQQIPEETQEQYQLLIGEVRRYYTTYAEDRASLARIRARLRQQAVTSVPAAEGQENAPFLLLARTEEEHSPDLRFVPTFAQDRPRYAPLTTLVAAVLLVVLIGSLAVALYLRQGGTAVPPVPAVAHGWSLLGTWSGTGNRTIAGKLIEVGHKYGWILYCTNMKDGWVSVQFNGPNGEAGGNSCSGEPREPLRPEEELSSPTVLAPIQTIEVMAAPSTSWVLLLFKGTYYPPLTIAPGWHTLHDEMDGTGSVTEVGIDVTLPQTWGLIFDCHGTGSFKIALQPGFEPTAPAIVGVQAPCDGQPNFDRYAQVSPGAHVAQIQITTGSENDWQLAVVGCTKGNQSCGNTSEPTSPGS
jgi:hypothetical protein